MKDVKLELIKEEGLKHLKQIGPDFSLDVFCKELCISKKTFYTYFNSKQEFLKKVLTEIIDEWKGNFQNFIKDDNIKLIVLNTYTYHIDQLILFNPCFIGNLNKRYPEEFTIVKNYFQDLNHFLISVLVKGQTKKKVRKDIDINTFLMKENLFFKHILFHKKIFKYKEHYIKLLSISLDSIIIIK